MVMSVTPMVCITLAFGLGYNCLTLTGACCACTYGATHVAAKRTAKLKEENRVRELILALLDRRIWPALCNAGGVNYKRSGNPGSGRTPTVPGYSPWTRRPSRPLSRQ